MTTKRLYYSKRIAFLSILVLSLLLSGVLVFGVVSSNKPTPAPNREFLKYLPPGATISNPEKDVISTDLGDGHQTTIIFYALPGTENQANILMLKPASSGYVRLWENVYEGSDGFADPSGVYDLNGNGHKQIVAFRTIGAACPGALDIYDYRNGEVTQITGPWANDGECQSRVEIKDLNGQGTAQIVVTSRIYGTNPDIYRWNGTKYVLSNRTFSQYYNDGLREILNAALSKDSIPASARVMWTRQATEVYLRQRHYFEAVQLCQTVLHMIDDPDLTEPNTVIGPNDSTEQRNRVLAYFEIEKIEAKAAIHRLLGDSYKASRNVHESRDEYLKATELEAEATNRTTKMPN